MTLTEVDVEWVKKYGAQWGGSPVKQRPLVKSYNGRQRRLPMDEWIVIPAYPEEVVALVVFP